jgi:hypothetical protein
MVSFLQGSLIPKECYFDTLVCMNKLRAGYFKDVVSVAALACAKVVRSNSVRPKSINTTHFKQEVLIRLAYFGSAYSKVLFNWNISADVDIQSTLDEVLAGRSPEDFWEVCHAAFEVPKSVYDASF